MINTLEDHYQNCNSLGFKLMTTSIAILTVGLHWLLSFSLLAVLPLAVFCIHKKKVSRKIRDRLRNKPLFEETFTLWIGVLVYMVCFLYFHCSLWFLMIRG